MCDCRGYMRVNVLYVYCALYALFYFSFFFFQWSPVGSFHRDWSAAIESDGFVELSWQKMFFFCVTFFKSTSPNLFQPRKKYIFLFDTCTKRLIYHQLRAVTQIKLKNGLKYRPKSLSCEWNPLYCIYVYLSVIHRLFFLFVQQAGFTPLSRRTVTKL